MGNSESKVRSRLKDRPLVVVVGGGFGGTALAKALDEHFNVLLFERKDYFFHNLGALRACVQPSFLKEIVTPFDKLLKYGSVVQAYVNEVSATDIKVQGRDEPIKFDYLVIATGTSYAFPAKVGNPAASALPAMYEEMSGMIKEAEHITIVGGGPVGVEFLGEICSQYQDKKVTLVHSREHLIPGMPRELGDQLLDQIKKSFPNAEVMLNDRLNVDSKPIADPEQDEPEEADGDEKEADKPKSVYAMSYLKGRRGVFTRSGTAFETDMVFFCMGSKINNNCYAETFKEQMNERGQLNVRPTFQLEGHDNIFAIGDCASRCANLGFLAGGDGQAGLVADSIRRLHDGKQAKPWPPRFKSFLDKKLMSVPLGDKNGSSYVPVLGLQGAWFTAKMKGQDLYAPTYQAVMGYKPGDAFREGVAKEADDDLVSRMARAAQVDDGKMKTILGGGDDVTVTADDAHV